MKSVRELTLKEFKLLPDKIYNKIKGKFILEMDGEIFYGFHKADDAYRALKPQKTTSFKKINY